MKKFIKVSGLIVLAIVFTLGLNVKIAKAATSPSLGTAGSFAILAGSEITNVPISAITGNVGLSPATGAGIGLTAAQVNGDIYSVDAAGPAGIITKPGFLTTVTNDLITAYDGLAALDNAACTGDYSGAGPVDLTLKSPLGPGVYCADSFILTDNLTLTGSTGVWIFRAATTIITSPASTVTGGDPCNVWWRAETSATLDTTTSFIGNLLALTSITMNTGATLDGRALARNAAVTLDSNTIDSSMCVAVQKKAYPVVSSPTITSSNPTATEVSSLAPVVPVVSPKMPNTGEKDDQKNSILQIVILSVALVLVLASAFVVKKRKTV